MRRKLRKHLDAMVPGLFWRIVERDEVGDFLTGDLSDVSLDVVEISETLQQKAKRKGLPDRRTDPPGFWDIRDRFLEAMRSATFPEGERRVLVRLWASEGMSFSELKGLENGVAAITDATPLVFVARGGSTEHACLRALVTTGRPCREGRRLAFDLDGTLTRWPEHFARMSQRNRDAGGFNLVISTRHEPKSSSCFKLVYDREKRDLKRTEACVDRLVHAWLDFDLWLELMPYFTNMEWFNRCLWTKAFFCRLFRADVYFDDQQINIDRMAELAPDVRTVLVPEDAPPEWG